MHDVSEAAKALKALRRRARLSVRALAELLGWKAPTYQHYEDRYHKRQLPYELALKASALFVARGVPFEDCKALFVDYPIGAAASVDDLLASAGGAGGELAEALAEAIAREARARPEPAGTAPGGAAPAGPHGALAAALRTQLRRDLPVYGTAAGAAEGSFELNAGEAIDQVRRPPALDAARDVYALYVVEDSMAPRFEQGELVFVHPGKPALPGNDVVVELQEGEHAPRRALIKRLVRRTARALVLEQFNPRRRIEVAIDKVVSVHRILTQNELYGV